MEVNMLSGEYVACDCRNRCSLCIHLPSTTSDMELGVFVCLFVILRNAIFLVFVLIISYHNLSLLKLHTREF